MPWSNFHCSWICWEKNEERLGKVEDRLFLELNFLTKVTIPSFHISVGIASFLRKDNGNPLQYSCLENPMDGGAWWAAVHGVAKSQAGLSDFTFTFHFHALEKEMATHASVLAWRIPGTGEPGGLPSMASCRVGHDCSDLAAAAASLPITKVKDLRLVIFALL